MDEVNLNRLVELAGIIDRERCRQALVKCGNNVDAALKYLKKHQNETTNRDMVKRKGKHV